MGEDAFHVATVAHNFMSLAQQADLDLLCSQRGGHEMKAWKHLLVDTLEFAQGGTTCAFWQCSTCAGSVCLQDFLSTFLLVSSQSL